METNNNSKKIVILGLILLIVAGLIVVALKGFRVSLLFGKHEIVELKVGKAIDKQVVEEICQEIFQGKRYIVKELEVFGDSFQINVEAITDDEKANLIQQVNEKFETNKTIEDLHINSIANKRLRDIIKPYILPMLLVFSIVTIYVLIRFRKIEAFKIVFEYLWKIILTQIVVVSIIAIIRIPVNDLLINGLMIMAIAQLVWFINRAENRLTSSKEV